MNNKSMVLGLGIVVVLVAGGMYLYTMDKQMGADTNTNTTSEPTIAWNFSEAPETNDIPHTTVEVIVNGKSHTVGTFAGSCAEIGATGGIDSNGLLAGELSAVQCWFAGGGDEVGVFAEEDGGITLLVGELGEGIDGAGMFRGNFKIRSDIEL